LKGDWDLGEDGWKDEMDTNLRVLSVVAGQQVQDIVAAEPGSPAEGDIVILDETHATHPNEIAVYDEAAWHYTVPLEGMEMLNLADSKRYRFDGAEWMRASAPSIQAVVSAATVTPTFDDDLVKVTAQAAGLLLANPTGTAVPGWGLAVRIKDDGTARAITYDTQYRAIGVTLPSTTVIGKTIYLGLIYNADDTKWDVVSVVQEA
jgi:hypothetical protein